MMGRLFVLSQQLKYKAMSPFVEAVTEESLVLIYLLPLTHTRRQDFKTRIINAHVTRDLTTVILQLEKPSLDAGVYPYTQWSQLDEQSGELRFYAAFTIDPQFRKDVECFIKGKYSKFSVVAKDLICNNSGLLYNLQERGKFLTDARLLALESTDTDEGISKRQELVYAWSNELGDNCPLTVYDELMSIPDESIYTDLTTPC